MLNNVIHFSLFTLSNFILILFFFSIFFNFIVVEEHQQFQRKLENLNKELVSKEAHIIELATNLKTVDQLLNSVLQSEKSNIQSIQQSSPGILFLLFYISISLDL